MQTAHESAANKKLLLALLTIVTSFALPTQKAKGQSGPPMPPVLVLDSYSFLETNFYSDYGYPPVRETNALSILDWGGNALLLDTTNEVPAYLDYNIVETNGHVNIDLEAGAIFALVVPDWASADTNQLGQGPGHNGYLVAAGDWSSGSPQGLWTIYVDAAGTNMYFGGVSNFVATTYVSAPISWATNSLHMIGVTYSTNSMLYLDGQLAATGGPVSIVPNTNTWTNGFCVGSDDAGYEQFRGIFLYLELSTTNVFLYESNYFTSDWASYTNQYYAWLGSPGENDDTLSSPGQLNPHGSSLDCITGSNVYITDITSAIVPGHGVTVTFAIEGGSNGIAYDVFSTTNLVGPGLTNSVWTWLGQGTNCGIYQVTNQTGSQSFFVLGTPLLAPDGSGATVAYEALIPNWDKAETIIREDDIVVSGPAITSSGSNESCPGAYAGYVIYTLAPPVWGWPPSTNTTVFTATDTNRTNTRVEYVGAYGDEGCSQTTVTIPYPPFSPAYRFSIYFTNDVPTTNYPISLTGFNP